MNAHERPGQGATNDWLTPRWIVDALGPFDLDVAASEADPFRCAPRGFTWRDDGLTTPWSDVPAYYRKDDGAACKCPCHSRPSNDARGEMLSNRSVAFPSNSQCATDEIRYADYVEPRTRGSAKLNDALIPSSASDGLIKSGRTQYLSAAERLNESGVSEITTSVAHGTLESLTDGEMLPGNNALSLGCFDAPIATEANDSRKTILSPSPTQDSLEPFPATWCQPASDATPESATETPSNGPILTDSSSFFATCAGCRRDGMRKAMVFANPPYGPHAGRFVTRLAEHGNGIALVFARTETRTFSPVLARASVVLFIAGRLRFERADGGPAGSNAGAPSMLLGSGDEARARLLRCSIPGVRMSPTEPTE